MKKIQLGGHRKGSNIRGYVLVDDEDFDELNKTRWFLGKDGYALMSLWFGRKVHTIRMHRVIMCTPKELYTDHRDENRLNNQKSNLRICTPAQNKRNSRVQRNNTTGFKGVGSRKGTEKFEAGIRVNYKQKYLGLFNSPEEAALAYNEAAKKYYGEFASLNDIALIKTGV